MRVEIDVKRENGIDYEARLRREFRLSIDPRLVAVILGLAFWVWWKFGVKLIITCLNRTIEENTAVGGYQFSAHLSDRAVDLRTWNLTGKQINEIIEYLHSSWGDFLYVKYHDSGSGKHLHLNIRHQYRKIAK